MASGDLLAYFTGTMGVPPATDAAKPDLSTATPPHVFLKFDAATDWSINFEGVLPPNYDGGGTTSKLEWIGVSATANDVVWTLSWERILIGTLNLDTASFATANTVTDTAAGTAGLTNTASITHTDGAQMDSVAAGESFRLTLSRDANNGSDTMAGYAGVFRLIVLET